MFLETHQNEQEIAVGKLTGKQNERFGRKVTKMILKRTTQKNGFRHPFSAGKSLDSLYTVQIQSRSF